MTLLLLLLHLSAIDTMKTVLQVDSYEGFRSLMRRVRAGKIGVLYAGAVANSIAAVMGHYPWVCKRTLLYCETASCGSFGRFFLACGSCGRFFLPSSTPLTCYLAAFSSWKCYHLSYCETLVSV